MTVNELKEKLGLRTFAIPEPDLEVKGGYTGDLLSWVMGKAKAQDAWVTIMSNTNTVAVALLSGISVIILAEGVEPDANVAQTAESRGINVLGSDLSGFELCAAISRLI
jgi:hypothetical protein